MFALIVHINRGFLVISIISALNIIDNKNNNSVTLSPESSIQEVLDSTFHVPGDKWTTTAIKDIAYYLRDHKFNEWDRRYYQEKPAENFVGFFRLFPTPPLRSLHWEVKANCHVDFYNCINYLHSIIETAPYLRVEDTAVLINANLNELNEPTIKNFNHDCKEKHNYANKIGLPFDDPVEKFQWRTSASYFMCWYTMLGIPALSMIGESCDNFANCLGQNLRSHNHDPRADDKFSFACALYSFCPDPCCPIKHIESNLQCRDDDRNVCFTENSEGNSSVKQCHMDRKQNQSLKDIIRNRWNISCNCKNGFEWKSEFGMCVDINECLSNRHICDTTSQDCLNLPGAFHCICKWGFILDDSEKGCLKSNSTMSESYNILRNQ
ncbi:uncharacterized protein [Epargyreus clarus]|uniref:uncharacterized protein n=1 Tax=Epargyreus clarus TaxID=520877 RepID=UPI003C2C303F